MWKSTNNPETKAEQSCQVNKNISKADSLLNGKHGYLHEIDEVNMICWVKFYEDIGNIARFREKSRPKTACDKATPIYLWKQPVSFHLISINLQSQLVLFTQL